MAKKVVKKCEVKPRKKYTVTYLVTGRVKAVVDEGGELYEDSESITMGGGFISEKAALRIVKQDCKELFDAINGRVVSVEKEVK